MSKERQVNLFENLLVALNTEDFEKADDIIMDFRGEKEKDFEILITWLTYTLPYKHYLKYRKGLYEWAKLFHPEELLKGLE